MLLYLWGRFGVKQLRMWHPHAVTRTTAGTMCAWDFVCVCPSGLPFGNTVKSYCLSSCHSCLLCFSTFNIVLITFHPSVSHSSFKRRPNLPVAPFPIIRLSRTLIILLLDGDLIANQIFVFVTAFVSNFSSSFLCIPLPPPHRLQQPFPPPSLMCFPATVRD